MPTLYESFTKLLSDRVDSTLEKVSGQSPLDGVLAVDLLNYLDTSAAKIGASKPIAKAYFELSNSRVDLVAFARNGLNLFWAPSVKMQHPYGSSQILGYHPSAVSSPSGFSVFLDHSEEDQRKLLTLNRKTNPNAYAGTMARLMASGTLNAFHALSTLKHEDFDIFNKPEYQQILMDIMRCKEGALSSSPRNKHSICEVLWLTGHQGLAKQLLQAQSSSPDQPQPDLVTSLQMALQAAFLTDDETYVSKIIEMATDFYAVDEQHSTYDLALARFIKSPLADQAKLGSMLLARARQAHELGEIDRIRAWLPGFLSQPSNETKNIHGSPFLWTVLALHPTWISGNNKLAESMGDGQYLRTSVSFTDPQSWRELVELSAADGSDLFWCLSKLNSEVVVELKLESTVVSMFLNAVTQEKQHFSTLSSDQSKVWELARKATTKLAFNLGLYCRQESDQTQIEAVFEALGQPEYRKAFLEPLPRFPHLVRRLPAQEVDSLMGGDLGL